MILRVFTVGLITSCHVAGAQQTVIDPRATPFGAKGDGVTDDTEALNAAAAALPASGGVLLLRGGEFAIHGQPDSRPSPESPSRAVLLHSNTTLRCEGATLVAEGSDANGIDLVSNLHGLAQLGDGKPRPAVLDHDITVEGCRFRFPHWQVGAVGNAVQMLLVEHVTFAGNTCVNGAACFSSFGSRDVAENGNRALGVTNAAFDHYAGGENFRVTDNYADVAANSSINSFGIQFTGSDGVRATPISDVVISGNVIRKAGDNGAPIGLDGGDEQPIGNVIIIGNHVSVALGADAPGIVSDTSGSNILIAHNLIDGTRKQPAIRVKSRGLAGNVTVDGNQLVNCGYAAPYRANIELESRGNTVIGNHASGCQGRLLFTAGQGDTIGLNSNGP